LSKTSFGFCVVFLAAAVLFAADAPARYAKLDGMRIHYENYGAGKQAVVFIHGWTCDLTFWRMQAPVYEKRRSLLIDLPGHGESDKPEIAYTQDLFARSVEAVMLDSGVEKAILVGHSMGTPVALTFLKRYPEKVSGLVIVDGFIARPPKDDAEREKQAAQSAEMVKMYRTPDYKSAMSGMFKFMFTDQTPAAMQDQIRTKMLSAPQYVVASAMEGMLALGPLAASTRFPVPAMAIMAKRPSQATYEEYLRTLFPDLRIYQAWEGAGHFLMMEQPKRFNTALTEFLDGIK
jgi:pimeloyl-ACP methyl ester carboxylesterase